MLYIKGNFLKLYIYITNYIKQRKLIILIVLYFIFCGLLNKLKKTKYFVNYFCSLTRQAKELDDEWPESIFHHVGNQSASYPVSV